MLLGAPHSSYCPHCLYRLSVLTEILSPRLHLSRPPTTLPNKQLRVQAHLWLLDLLGGLRQ